MFSISCLLLLGGGLLTGSSSRGIFTTNGDVFEPEVGVG